MRQQVRGVFVCVLGLSLLGTMGKAEARRLNFTGFSDPQKASLETAFAEAEKIAFESYYSLYSLPSAERATSRRYLRACDGGSYVTMTLDDWEAFAANFFTLYQALRDMTMDVTSGGSDCDDSTAAYFRTDGIHICLYFWDLRTQRPYGFSSQAGAVLHEVTHDVLDTGDNNSSLPNQGLKTARTYQNFAMNDPWFPMSCLSDEPHPWCQPGKPLAVPSSGCADQFHTTEVVAQVCAHRPQCCETNGKWDWGCVQEGAVWARQQTGIGDVCGRDAWVQGPIISPGPFASVQYYPRDFSVFVLNDAIAFPDVQGSVAAGGQFQASSFYLNGPATYWTALLAGGFVQVDNGTIRGSVFSPNLEPFEFASSKLVNGSVTVVNGASVNSTPTSPIDFGDAFAKLRSLSQALKRYQISASANVTITNGGTGLDIVSNEKELNIIALSASQLIALRSINLSVPTGSPVIVNVAGGGDVTFQNMQITSTASILWNFPDATTRIQMSGMQFWGSVLAPDADVYFDWGGMIIGTLVAKSARPLYTATGASFEMHLGPFGWPITASAPSQTIYQINCGSSSGVAPYGPDQYYSGGTARKITNAINTAGVTDPAPSGVYQSERYGNITYTLPNLVPGGQYTVRLHFAETYWTASGKRKFNVTINGTAVLSNFDIFATTTARYKALVREYTANANSSGEIVLKFVTVTDNATVEGIELIR